MRSKHSMRLYSSSEEYYIFVCKGGVDCNCNLEYSGMNIRPRIVVIEKKIFWFGRSSA